MPALFDRLPQAPVASAGPLPLAVVLRLRGHLRTNLTFVNGLETCTAGVSGAGGSLTVCGLQPATITQLRSAGLPHSITLVAQRQETDGSLAAAYSLASRWLEPAGEQQPPEPQP